MDLDPAASLFKHGERAGMSAAVRCPARFEIKPLEPFGIELIGDLSEPLVAEEEAFLRDIVEEHAVLVARNQKLMRMRSDQVEADGRNRRTK